MEYIGLITAAFFVSMISQRIICWQYQKYYDQLEFPVKSLELTVSRLVRLTVWTVVFWLGNHVMMHAEWYIWLAFGIVGASVMITDFEQEVIFDWFLIFFAAVVMVCIPWQYAVITDCLIGMLLCGAVMLGLAMLTRGAIGGGDIKLTMALGCWLGMANGMTMLIYGLFIGGIAAGILLLSGRKGRTDTFAYGPYFVIGAWLVKLLN